MTPRDGEPPRWIKWLQLIPWVLVPLFVAGMAWISSRIDAADANKEVQYRREFVLREQYEADQRSRDYLRDQLDKRLERMDQKLDELISRKK